MRKTKLLIILFSLFAFLAKSQIKYGIKAGGGICDILESNYEESIKSAGTVYNPLISLQAGGFFSDTIITHLFWKTEAMLSRYGYKELFYEMSDRRGENYQPEDRGNCHLYYLNLPVVLQTNLLFPDWLTLNCGLNSGFYLDWLSNNKYYLPLHHFDLKFTGGISIVHKKFQVDFEYAKSLKDINMPKLSQTLRNKILLLSFAYVLSD